MDNRAASGASAGPSGRPPAPGVVSAAPAHRQKGGLGVAAAPPAAHASCAAAAPVTHANGLSLAAQADMYADTVGCNAAHAAPVRAAHAIGLRDTHTNGLPAGCGNGALPEYVAPARDGAPALMHANGLPGVHTNGLAGAAAVGGVGYGGGSGPRSLAGGAAEGGTGFSGGKGVPRSLASAAAEGGAGLVGEGNVGVGSDPPGPLPMLASACPGWVCYAEKTHGEYALPYISTAKSPQARWPQSMLRSCVMSG